MYNSPRNNDDRMMINCQRRSAVLLCDKSARRCGADTLGVNNPIRYRGYYYNFEMGFYYLQSRYYDPELLGRTGHLLGIIYMRMEQNDSSLYNMVKGRM